MSALALGLLLAAPASAYQPNQYDAAWETALPWKLNNAGSSSPDFADLADVEAVFEAAYVIWEAPACSGFQATYGGRTATLSSANQDNKTTHGFLQNWPGGYGNPSVTLGITIQRFRTSSQTWVMYEADVSFNEDVHTFVDAPAAGPSAPYTADLYSIAAHEFGHSLGLDHSGTRAATMFATYDGTINARTLHQDDINGVCALYPNGTPLPDDDGYEDNDDPNDAVELSCGQTIQATGLDTDWYYVRTNAPAPLEVELDLGAGVNLDLALYKLNGNTLSPLASGQKGTGVDELVSVSTQAAGAYYVVVEPVSGTGDYELTITCTGSSAGNSGGNTGPQLPDPVEPDEHEENDSNAEPARLDCPGTYALTAEEEDQDWFLFRTEDRGDIEATVTWSAAGLDLDLYLVDTEGVVDASEQETGAQEAVGSTGVPAGTYGVVVNPYVGEGAYTLVLACSGNPDPGDSGGANNGGWPPGVDSADTGGTDTDEGEVVSVTCGCASTGGAASLAPLALAGLLLGRRRRR
ncbi:MAG: matrixin family metalloprotease [Alphaproteobacteria bacterium]|nr:matrixin family metalloprotease [Alphaproteobacteria bacterium]